MTDTICTAAGDYTVTYPYDDSPEPPYNEGLGFVFDGRRQSVDVTDGPAGIVDEMLSALRDDVSGYRANGRPTYRYSSAGIARYLRIAHGLYGVRMVSSDYHPYAPSTERERIAGIAWAPADVPAERADAYTDAAISEYRAYATGNVFGWRLTAPGGEFVDSCWGYYGFEANHACALEAATECAHEHAIELRTSANLVGAGFVGII